MLVSNSCGCGRRRMHVERIRGGRARAWRRRRRNVCGADCGNVISRYVAVGRPSSSWHRHLPTCDLSFVSRRGEPRSTSLSPTRRAKASSEANRRNFPSLTDFSFIFLAFLPLHRSRILALLCSGPVRPRGSESRAEFPFRRFAPISRRNPLDTIEIWTFES
jgi:hypothetical protein